jgi:plastocyanin
MSSLRKALSEILFTCAALGAIGAVGLPAAPAAAGRTVEVALQHHAFVPKVTRVRTGDNVRFTNGEDELHSVTLVDREELLDEVFIDPGQSFTFVVPDGLEPGTYVIACTIHVDMKGQLVVSGV